MIFLEPQQASALPFKTVEICQNRQATLDEAHGNEEKGFLVAAERNVKKVDFADFGNSPLILHKKKLQERTHFHNHQRNSSHRNS